MNRLFPSRRRVVLLLAPIYVAIAIGLSALASCRGCDIAGVFYFCSDEGPHDVVISPPPAWRARAAEVQQELYAYTRERASSDTARFVWRDPDTIVFVRVLGHGIPGAAMRAGPGDSIFFNAGEENDAGSWRHEFVHWVQPGNEWLQPFDRNGVHQIHWRPVFEAAHAPLVASGA